MTQTQHHDNAHVHSVAVTPPATYTHANVRLPSYYSLLTSAIHFLHIVIITLAYLSLWEATKKELRLGHNVAICVTSNMTAWLIRHDTLCGVNCSLHQTGVLLDRESWRTNNVTSCLHVSFACSQGTAVTELSCRQIPRSYHHRHETEELNGYRNTNC